MSDDLVEKTLIAASLTAAEGHVHTSKAMIEFARGLQAYTEKQQACSLSEGTIAQEIGADRPPDCRTQ